MFMHVKAKTMAFSGLLLALTVIFMVLGSVIETSTLFLLAAASFFVGIIIREFGLRIGAAFYAAGVILGFITAPNKFYVFTFAAMGLYIWGREAHGDGSCGMCGKKRAGRRFFFLNTESLILYISRSLLFSEKCYLQKQYRPRFLSVL